jgi:hypothetical protein
MVNRNPSTLQIGVRSGIHDGIEHYSLLSDILTNFETGQEEIRKHKRGVRTDVKTERSVVRNDVEDRLERIISAVSVGQEELDNRFLKQDRGQTGR